MTDQPSSRCAAVLIDYQNLYYVLKNRLQAPAQPGDTAADLIEAVRERLDSEGIRLARGFAYADFGGLDEHVRHVQRALYLHGIQPFYVPATMHRNTTDLQLAIDALKLRDEAPDVDTFVLLSGDRDYIPVVQALQAAGRRVIMVAFRGHLSTHLLDRTASGYFIDAADLLSDDARDLLRDDDESPALETETTFSDIKELPYDIDIDALEVIEKHFGQYDEVYLTPLLRKLSDELGDIEDHDPKSMVGDLEACGAVRLERRRGMPYDYTVLIVNSDHPAVVEVKEDMAGEHDYSDEDEGDFSGPYEPNDYENDLLENEERETPVSA